jgi:hypothetical protein
MGVNLVGEKASNKQAMRKSQRRRTRGEKVSRGRDKPNK